MRQYILSIVLGLCSLLFAPCSISAQSNVPSSEFQSTSSMVGSGSSYASNPSLNADGTAAYNSPSYAPQRAISGPNRIAPVTPEGDPTPIGDEILPLLLMALVAGAVIVTKKRLIKL